MDTLVELLRPLPQLGRVSHLIIDRDPDGWWLIAHYAGMADVVHLAMRPREPEGWEIPGERYDITLDHDRMPDGVTTIGMYAYPRPRHRLPLTGADPQRGVHAMLRALDESGIVGGIDVARFEAATLDAITRQPFPRWHIRTHASSDRERGDWLRGLPDESGSWTTPNDPTT